jgi:transcriptional regulator of acetoin/glycerol metabolism
MSDAWLADVGPDPKRWARQIARAHSAFVAGEPLSGVTGAAAIRELVVQSWRRSAPANVDPDKDPPVITTDDDLETYRAAHPLALVLPVLRELVGAAAEDSQHLWAVSDAAGRLLWVEGHRAARDRASRMNFVEGALWDEAHAGTNAPGTALALDHEVQIFAAEHFRHTVQRWTCAAAPIHDPATGRILGVVDVTGGDVVAHPHSLALVRAAARAAEGALRWRTSPASGLAVPVPREAVQLLALGRADGELRDSGRTVRLSRRHTEIMIVLAEHPEGVSGERLADLLYDDDTSPTTLRVEIARLRRIVGDVLESRPYRLAVPVRADFLDVEAALRRRDVAAAVAGYAGPLLPGSEAPGVATRRRWLEVALRSAVLSRGDPDVLRAWADGAGFDDLEVWERLAAEAPAGSAHATVAATRIRRLRQEYGLPL